MLTSLSLVIIIVTLVGVAVGRYPWLRMNRATIALVGATALIILGAISLEEAYQAIDLDTILLLFAMMVINANLRISGFFQVVTRRVASWARSPKSLLAWILFSAGILSALFLNDTIVLIFTPLVIEITLALERKPVPYLIGMVAAANIGSAASIVGNPQNMIIGIASGIPFARFSALLLPAALAGIGIAWLGVIWLYPGEFKDGSLKPAMGAPVRTYLPLLRKSLLATGLMLAAFLAGAPVPLAALGAASFLLVTRRLKPSRVFQEVDWGLLVFFGGLFIVTGALETSGLTEAMFAIALPVAERGVPALAGVSALLSNLVSNVPAVLLFKPFIPGFPAPEQAWLTLALATTFAGNLTLLGSVANLIMAESAGALGVRIGFVEYLRMGIPVTLLTLLAGVAWLVLIFP